MDGCDLYNVRFIFRLLIVNLVKVFHMEISRHVHYNALHEVWMVLTTNQYMPLPIAGRQCNTLTPRIQVNDNLYMYRLCLDNQIVYKSSDYVFKTASLSDVTTYTRYACSRFIIPKMNSLNSDLKMYLYFLEAS